LSPLGLAVHSLNLENLENTIFYKVSAATSRQGVDAGIITLLLPHRSSGPTHRFPGLRPSLVRVLRAPAPLRNPLARLKAKISFPPSRRQTRHTASRRPPTTTGITPASWNLASAPHRAGSRPKDVSLTFPGAGPQVCGPLGPRSKWMSVFRNGVTGSPTESVLRSRERVADICDRARGDGVVRAF